MIAKNNSPGRDFEQWNFSESPFTAVRKQSVTVQLQHASKTEWLYSVFYFSSTETLLDKYAVPLLLLSLHIIKQYIWNASVLKALHADR